MKLPFPVLAVAATAAYGLAVDPLSGQGGIDCLWRSLTGQPCPGCGLTRAVAWLVRGDLVSALAANWLVAPLVIVAAQHAVIVVRRDVASRHKETPDG